MKRYNKPSMELLQAECLQMVAVSLQDGNADPSAEVLTKEDTDWEFWEDE